MSDRSNPDRFTAVVHHWGYPVPFSEAGARSISLAAARARARFLSATGWDEGDFRRLGFAVHVTQIGG